MTASDWCTALHTCRAVAVAVCSIAGEGSLSVRKPAPVADAGWLAVFALLPLLVRSSCRFGVSAGV